MHNIAKIFILFALLAASIFADTKKVFKLGAGSKIITKSTSCRPSKWLGVENDSCTCCILKHTPAGKMTEAREIKILNSSCLKHCSRSTLVSLSKKLNFEKKETGFQYSGLVPLILKNFSGLQYIDMSSEDLERDGNLTDKSSIVLLNKAASLNDAMEDLLKGKKITSKKIGGGGAQTLQLFLIKEVIGETEDGYNLYFVQAGQEVDADHTPALKKLENGQYELFIRKGNGSVSDAINPTTLNIATKDLENLWANKQKSLTGFLKRDDKIMKAIIEEGHTVEVPKFILKGMGKALEEVKNLEIIRDSRLKKYILDPNKKSEKIKPVLALDVNNFSYTDKRGAEHSMSLINLAGGKEIGEIILNWTKNPEDEPKKALATKALYRMGHNIGLIHNEFMIPLGKIFGKTYVHGDMHPYNLFYDDQNDRIVFIDNESFALSIVNPKDPSLDIMKFFGRLVASSLSSKHAYIKKDMSKNDFYETIVKQFVLGYVDAYHPQKQQEVFTKLYQIMTKQGALKTFLDNDKTVLNPIELMASRNMTKRTFKTIARDRPELKYPG